MPNRNYINGRNAEYLARNLLLEQGYEVLRAAGSKGAVDLIAWSATEMRFIQIKKGRGAIRPAEKEKLCALPRPPHASVELWIRERGKWAIELLQ